LDSLSFYDESGNPLAIPLAYPQTGTVSFTATVKQTLTPGQTLIMQTQGKDSLASVSGSAVLTSTGAVGASAIFRLSSSGQEGTVPLETRNATSYTPGFDNTNGSVIGLALANNSSKAANLAITIRDDTGITIANESNPLKSNGRTQTVLTNGSGERWPARNGAHRSTGWIQRTRPVRQSDGQRHHLR
jgi:hypothetical protein